MTDVVTPTYGLEQGAVELESIGPIAFGPESILFVADNASATIFAIDLGATNYASRDVEPADVEKIDARLAAYLGCSRADVHIRDMAVRPVSQQVYLSVTRDTGDAAIPLVISVSPSGELTEVPLQNVHLSRFTVDDAPALEDERRDARLADDSEDAKELDVRGIHLLVAGDALRSVTTTDMA